MRQIRIGILFLILGLASCSSPPAQSPPPPEVTELVDIQPTMTTEVHLTNTVTPLPEVTSTPTPTTAPDPVSEQPTYSQPAAIIARVAGGTNSFILVGGSQNGSWKTAAEIAEIIEPKSGFQQYSTFEFRDWTTAQELVYEPICDQYFLTVDPDPISQSAVGVSGAWDVIPRMPQELPIDLEVYLKAITGWQMEQASSQPIPVIDRIWKVDLEGNGTDEVIINGTRYAESSGHNVGPRDYSVVLLRTVIGSEVVTVELVGDYYSAEVANQFPQTYNLELIGDLNGDGRMEVVVGVTRWEGTGVMVFEIDGKEANLVLSVMCSQ